MDGHYRTRAKQIEKEHKGGKNNDCDPDFPADGWDYAPMNTYAPPCLRKWGCQGCCEYSCCCRAVGRCGSETLSQPKYRKVLLYFATVCNLGALVFSLVAAFALSSSTPILRSTCWSRGEVANVNATKIATMWNTIDKSVTCVPRTVMTDMRYYIGLSGVGVEAFEPGTDEPLCSAVSRYQPWSEAYLCINEQNGYSDYCKDCRTAASGLTFPVLMAVVTMIPTLQTDIQRMYRRYDLNCQKFMAVFIGGVFGFVNTLATFSGFIHACIRELPKDLVIGGKVVEVEWNVGIGLKLLMVATFFKLVDATIHGLIKTPASLWKNREGRIAEQEMQNTYHLINST